MHCPNTKNFIHSFILFVIVLTNCFSKLITAHSALENQIKIAQIFLQWSNVLDVLNNSLLHVLAIKWNNALTKLVKNKSSGFLIERKIYFAIYSFLFFVL